MRNELKKNYLDENLAAFIVAVALYVTGYDYAAYLVGAVLVTALVGSVVIEHLNKHSAAFRAYNQKYSNKWADKKAPPEV